MGLVPGSTGVSLKVGYGGKGLKLEFPGVSLVLGPQEPVLEYTGKVMDLRSPAA